MKRTGIVYLIHFDRPIGNMANAKGQAQHYIGWTVDVPNRMKEHATGHGAAIMAYLKQVGIAWNVVRTWRGSRYLERKLKNRRSAPFFCPCCNQKIRGRFANRPIQLR